MYICICVYVYVCMYACMYVCMYVYVYMCMYVYVYMCIFKGYRLCRRPPTLDCWKTFTGNAHENIYYIYIYSYTERENIVYYVYTCLCVYHPSLRMFVRCVSSRLSVVVFLCVFGCIGRSACMSVVCLAVCFLSVCQSLCLG